MANFSHSTKNEIIFLNKICDKVNDMSLKLDNKKGNMPEIIALLMYVIFHCILSANHEACFDEAHAWNIARDATVYETLFEIPHWEGHPSLWHLLLMPFAKLGLGYQISMTLITLIFSGAAVYLLLFKSPFPRVIKLILPFTYFFFYQYGVIARPYCMMMTAFMLIALLYQTKDCKPGRYIISLIFLCATSAFGVAFAAGLACSWVLEIVSGYVKDKKAGKNISLFKDKRVIGLLILLIYSVVLLLRAYPQNAAGAMSYKNLKLKGTLSRLLYLCFGVISDLFFTNTYTEDYLINFSFSSYELIICSLIGVAILCVVFYYAKKNATLKEFLFPFASFVLFSTFIYFCLYNSGLPLLLIVFWAWITIQRRKGKLQNESLPEKKNRYLLMFSLVGMLLPLIWAVTSFSVDMQNEYTSGKGEAEFLIQNKLSEYDICVEWEMPPNTSEKMRLENCDLKRNLIMDRMSAYMGNIDFVNWPFDSSLYVKYNISTTEEEKTEIAENIRNNSKPSILIGEPDLTLVNGSEYDMLDDYRLVYRGTNKKVWKGIGHIGKTSIFLRKDIEL